MPFLDVDENRWARYYPQFKALKEKIDEFHILYHTGKPPQTEYFTFHKIHFKKKLTKLDASLGSINKTFRSLLFWHKIWNIADRISNNGFDLVYSLTGGMTPIISNILKHKLNCSGICRVRGDPRLERSMIYDNWFDYIVRDKLDFKALCSLDLLIPISTRIKDVMISYGVPDFILTEPIPNGVDINKFKPMIIDHEFTVGYAGRISPEKGGQFLQKLIENTPDIKYLVAGPIQMNWQAPKNCSYLGFVSHDDMPCYYNKCDIIIMPSVSEGFSNSLLESYASGIPVVGSKVVFPSDVEKYGYKLPLHLPSWIKLLRNLKKEKDVLKDIGKDARKYVKKFSWENYGERMYSIFNQVVTHT